MAQRVYRFTGFMGGVYAAANIFDQPQGTVPRVSNLVLTERGALLTVDGTRQISVPGSIAPPTMLLYSANRSNINVFNLTTLALESSFGLSLPIVELIADGSGNLWGCSTGTTSVYAWPKTTVGSGISPHVTLSGFTNPQFVGFDGTNQIYVFDRSSPPSINVFPADSSGSPTPTQKIQGTNTGIGATTTQGFAVDASGNMYVLQTENVGVNSISIFAAGGTGNIAPTAVISGASTQLDNESIGLALDGQGFVWAGGQVAGQAGAIAFPVTGSGNIAPTYAFTSHVFPSTINNGEIMNFGFVGSTNMFASVLSIPVSGPNTVNLYRFTPYQLNTQTPVGPAAVAPIGDIGIFGGIAIS